MANQRRITSGIVYFMVVKIVGLGIPFVVISACFALRVGNTVVSDCCLIIMSIYPIFGLCNSLWKTKLSSSLDCNFRCISFKYLQCTKPGYLSGKAC
ncbi:unnamed protein product [Auanema sp. JU1783]|nr:unnamed protein product [Auanema sp. JU1783]